MGEYLAYATLAVAIVVGLGRQVTVFTAFAPGLVIFRRFGRTRGIALVVVAALSAGVLAISLTTASAARSVPLAPLAAAWLLIGFAYLFDLERLFPALVRVRAVEPAAVAVDPDTVVLVVESSGTDGSTARRAYPLERMVMARHLVHDTLAGEPILVSYCALCRSGLAYRAELPAAVGPARRRKRPGTAPAFRVVGVFRRNLIMEDEATGTLWQQATGDAILGPLGGHHLELMTAWQMPWREARELPGITLAEEPEDAGHSPFASQRGMAMLMWATEHVMTPGYTRLSSELAARETVFGVVVDGAARAYPLARLGSTSTFTDQIGEVDVEVSWNESTGTLRVGRRDGGPDPVVERHWWLGWNEFHPTTSVWCGATTPAGRPTDDVRIAP